ncbi:MAG: OmpA family protein [Phycisphaerae bacterium]|nr:OmpA family protein [Phycisphaerae bacterium]
MPAGPDHTPAPDPARPDPAPGADARSAPAGSVGGDGGGSGRGGMGGRELAVVRAVLVGPEQARLAGLERRLDDPATRARELADALPGAIALRSSRDGQLARALAPTIESSLKRAVEQNPQPLVDAIFPIIGPAIRKAIGESLARMLQELSAAMAPQSAMRRLAWRLEALKTGKPYAEIVLLRTLRYRIEQALVIHRETGLLLLHAAMPAVQGSDPHSVSAMLTALQDFVRDSFGAAKQEGLEKLKVGGREVWVEAGPRAVIAVAIARTPNESLRPRLQEAVEALHLQFGQELAAFGQAGGGGGDAAPFARAMPIVEPLLGDVRLDDAAPRRISPVVWIVLAAIVLALAWWWGSAWLAQRRFDAALDALRATPGIVITETGHRRGDRGSQRFVAGLRDPIAADPMTILAEAGVKPEDVALAFKPYQSLDESFVLQRVAQQLAPPSSVNLALRGGRLFAQGRAPHAWLVRARRVVAQLPGVSAFDDSAVVDIDLAELESLRAAAERLQVRFVFATTDLAKGQEEMVNRMAQALVGLYEIARPAGIEVSIQIIGNTDGTGAEERNVRLSRDRADRLITLLVARGIPARDLAAVGVGSTQPVASESTDAAKERNRYATLRVSFSEAPLAVAAPGGPAPEKGGRP